MADSLIQPMKGPEFTLPSKAEEPLLHNLFQNKDFYEVRSKLIFFSVKSFIHIYM